MPPPAPSASQRSQLAPFPHTRPTPLLARQVKHPYAALADTANLPARVDPANKELYLADDEFEKLFKMPVET